MHEILTFGQMWERKFAIWQLFLHGPLFELSRGSASAHMMQSSVQKYVYGQFKTWMILEQYKLFAIKHDLFHTFLNSTKIAKFAWRFLNICSMTADASAQI